MDRIGNAGKSQQSPVSKRGASGKTTKVESVQAPKVSRMAAKSQPVAEAITISPMDMDTVIQCLLDSGIIPKELLDIGLLNECLVTTGEVPTELQELSALGSVGAVASTLDVAPEDLVCEPPEEEDPEQPEFGRPNCGTAPPLLPMLAGLLGLMGIRAPARIRSSRGRRLR
jgi:hypothetical protein